MSLYDRDEYYGFIARGGGEDIFFHKTDALSDPADMPEGQWILYDVEDTERGLEPVMSRFTLVNRPRIN
jgi:cold shock CspA family protein